MKVLIVGATGMVGSAAAKVAVAKGYQVRALTRKTSSRDKLGEAQNAIEFCEGDVVDKDSLVRAMDGQEALIIALRFNAGEKERGRTFEEVELGGVQNLVAAAQQQGLKKIAFVSVDGVGPDCVSGTFQANYKAEEAVVSSGIDYTVFQSSGMFFDFRDFHIPMVLRFGQTDTWPMGPLENRFDPLSHEDLARCLVDALTNSKASHLRLRIGGPETLRLGEILNMIVREAGIDTTYTQGTSKEDLIEMVKDSPDQSFFSPEEIQDFFKDRVIDHRQVKAVFDFEFQKVIDYIRKTVPEVKESMAAQQDGPPAAG